jgi:hypothetical protein
MEYLPAGYTHSHIAPWCEKFVMPDENAVYDTDFYPDMLSRDATDTS